MRADISGPALALSRLSQYPLELSFSPKFFQPSKAFETLSGLWFSIPLLPKYLWGDPGM